MSRLRIGELLGQMGKLSGHDIEEILQEQNSGNLKKTFGEIALTWGLCQPEHIWKAWADQLSDGFERVDLRIIGIDTQATGRLPRELAVRFCAMPVRLLDNDLVIAVSDPSHIAAFAAMGEMMHFHLKFVLAGAEDIRGMIERYYPRKAAAVA